VQISVQSARLCADCGAETARGDKRLCGIFGRQRLRDRGAMADNRSDPHPGRPLLHRLGGRDRAAAVPAVPWHTGGRLGRDDPGTRRSARRGAARRGAARRGVSWAGFDIASIVFLAALAPSLRSEAAALRGHARIKHTHIKHARIKHANRGWLLAISILVTLFILVSVASEMSDLKSPLTATLVIATLTLCWLFSNTA